ncbi:MAG: SDR family oxidoreductase [Planctomyces sp.]|nr:SDR family oxidoreductase [Planctomyces sp.]
MTERIAIVTGAGTGIGRASSLALLEAGWRVVLNGRRAPLLEETRQLAGPHAASARVLPADVTNPDDVARLFRDTVAEFGRVDLLFNNAGMLSSGVPFEDLSYDDWRQLVDANLNAAFLCSREAFRVMKAQSPQGGRIINNGSISATAPRPNSAPYTSTKHAITGLTKSLALDGRRLNIACGQIDIGNAETEMTARVKQGALQARGDVQPEPTMDVDNVARSVVHMASLPLDANVLFMTVLATSMPFVGRG